MPPPPFSRGVVIYKLRKAARPGGLTISHCPPHLLPHSHIFCTSGPLVFILFIICLCLSLLCVCVCGAGVPPPGPYQPLFSSPRLPVCMSVSLRILGAVRGCQEGKEPLSYLAAPLGTQGPLPWRQTGWRGFWDLVSAAARAGTHSLGLGHFNREKVVASPLLSPPFSL